MTHTDSSVADDQHLLDALTAVIPDDVTRGPDGAALSPAGRAGVREMRAGDWARYGHRHPRRVAAWLAAGVALPEVAARAETLGYQPGDPWVPTGWDLRDHPQPWPNHFPYPDGPLRRPQRWRAVRNRRQAHRDWQHTQRTHQAVDRELAAVSAHLAQQAIPGAGSDTALMAYDFAASTAAGPDAGLLAVALDAAAGRAHDLRELGEQACQRLGDPLLARWLDDQTRARGWSDPDNYRDLYRDRAEHWVHREAVSWCEVLALIADRLASLAEHLTVLDPDERGSARRLLDATRADQCAATRAWTAVREGTPQF